MFTGHFRSRISLLGTPSLEHQARANMENDCITPSSYVRRTATATETAGLTRAVSCATLLFDEEPGQYNERTNAETWKWQQAWMDDSGVGAPALRAPR
jgi:hypothetical protein